MDSGSEVRKEMENIFRGFRGLYMQRFPEICSQQLVFGKIEIKPLTPSDSFSSQSGYSSMVPNHNLRIELLETL